MARPFLAPFRRLLRLAGHGGGIRPRLHTGLFSLKVTVLSIWGALSDERSGLSFTGTTVAAPPVDAPPRRTARKTRLHQKRPFSGPLNQAFFKNISTGISITSRRYHTGSRRHYQSAFAGLLLDGDSSYKYGPFRGQQTCSLQ
jgi:hypothetical protein